MFPGRAGVVIDAERPVLERRGDGLVADHEVLREVLVVDPEAGGVEEAFFRREVEKQAPAVDFAVSERVGAAEGRDFAVLARGLEHERGPIDRLGARDVIPGVNQRITRALRGDLKSRADRVAALPEVVVAHGGIQTKRGGVRAVAVVEFDRPVKRKLVLHRQLHIHGVRFDARGEGRGDLEVAGLVEGDDVALDIVEIRHAPLGQRGGEPFDFFDVKKPRALDPQTADRRLGDLQHDHAGVDALRRDRDRNGLITLFVICFFEGGPGVFDIFRRPSFAKMAVYRLVHRVAREGLRADDPVFADEESLTRWGVLKWRGFLHGGLGFIPHGACHRQKHNGKAQLHAKRAARRLVCPFVCHP